jgi:hypothetical protein
MKHLYVHSLLLALCLIASGWPDERRRDEAPMQGCLGRTRPYKWAESPMWTVPVERIFVSVLPCCHGGEGTEHRWQRTRDSAA